MFNRYKRVNSIDVYSYSLDVQLKFSKHIEIQVNKANKMLGMIRRSYEFLDGDSL